MRLNTNILTIENTSYTNQWSYGEVNFIKSHSLCNIGCGKCKVILFLFYYNLL
jgi:hypothetical protein